jgi:SAM-dependent methyltransferase
LGSENLLLPNVPLISCENRGMVAPTSDHSLGQAWEDNADAWLKWARSADLDHAFWRLNMPALLELLPQPTGVTLDVGCGEGRLARELRRLGYQVVGLENSPSLAAAAQDADPEFEVIVADAANMPISSGSIDLAIVSLALMNMDDMKGAVSEIARVLKDGGILCFSILHPLNSWGDAGDVSYFETVAYDERIEANGEAMTFHDTHRPLSDYFTALETAGFLVERLHEPRPDDAYAASHAAARRWQSQPGFLHVRAIFGHYPIKQSATRT